VASRYADRRNLLPHPRILRCMSYARGEQAMKRTIFLLGAAAALGAGLPAFAAEQAPVMAGTPAGAKALANPYVMTVRNVTRPELTPGLAILEEGGATIGTVSHLAGNDVVVTDGKRDYRVPITQIYAYSQDGVDRFASRMTKLALKKHSRKAVASGAR
jgi:hypothetical protein